MHILRSKIKNWYTKLNLEKSKERILICEYPKVYKYDLQLNSKSFRQDEFKGEPAERTFST
ncbi:MAG: palindromic element RPE3 domain-containing protein [Rickettsia endosymbiont of Pentastiridius leporinus]